MAKSKEKMIEIKTTTGKTLHTCESQTLRTAVEDAGKKRINLRGADLRGAYLREANLRGADLGEADLRGAYLRGADLRGAYLGGAYLGEANLRGADLREADLRGAYLRGADLRGAYLRGADLRGADLYNTCLTKPIDRWDWCVANCLAVRNLDHRTLCLTTRAENQPHMRGPKYKIGFLYTAPWFSSCPTTRCHPGLHLQGKKENLLVAFWLDRLHLVGDKARVPEFRTVASIEEFESLTMDDMKPENQEN